jgi:DHA1 family multidrug resistance protein-like MFS transporter
MNVKVFATLFLAVFSVALGVGLVVPLLPVYAHELGATGLVIGLIFGAFSLSRTLLLPYFGRASDKKGRKPFITFGLLAYFLVSLAFMFTTSIGLFILIRFFQGIASAMIFPVALAYVGDITPERKEGFIMGLFNLSLYGGLSLGPVIGGIVKDTLGIQISFLTMGLFNLTGFLLCLAFLPPTKDESLRPRAQAPLNYMIIVKDKPLGGLFVFRLVYTACIGIVWGFLPLFADMEFHLSGSLIGILIMLGVLTTGLLQAPMGILADRLRKRMLIAIGGCMGGVAIFLLLLAKSTRDLFFCNILFGIGGGISMPSVMAMTVILGHRTHSMGSIMGLLTMAHSLGMLLGPILAGVMMDVFQLSISFIIGGTIMLLGVITTLALTKNFPSAAKDSV